MRKAKPHPRVTLATVAAAAEVSTTTVSVILSGREEQLRQFHPDTVARVRQSAERLGYSVNLFASGLPSKSTTFFALVIRDIGNEPFREWYLWGFEGDFLAGVMRASAAAGAYPIVCRGQTGADDASLGPIDRVAAGGAFGVIARSPHEALEKYLRSRIRQGQPVVVVFPELLSKWPTNAIDVDNTAVGQTAADLLARQERRRWLLVRPSRPHSSQRLRCEGFEAAARRYNATVETIEIPAPARAEYHPARDYLASRFKGCRFDGVFGVELVASVGSLLACLELGMRVGTDFHLVGCDCSLWHSPPLPRVTAVDVSWRTVGATAFCTLLDLARKGEHTFDSILVRPRVVPADTCPTAGASSNAAG